MKSIASDLFRGAKDTEYDREVTGNLKGKPANPVYSLNSFSAGGFLRMRLPTWRGRENARLIVSQIVLDGLNELKMAYPKTTAKRRRELESIRKLLPK